MTTPRFLSCCLVLLLWVPRFAWGADAAPAGRSVVVGPEYSANRGLFVPDDTRKSIGLKIVEVDEQQIPASFDFALYIYAQNGTQLSASGRVPFSHAQRLQPGQGISVREAKSASTSLPARITQVKLPEQGIGLAEVVVQLDASARFTVGTFLHATLSEASSRAAASIPRSALMHSTEGYFVYATSGDHFVRTPVKIAALSPEHATIEEGLYEGDRVVAEPVLLLWMTELAAIKGGHSCCAVPEDQGRP